MVGGDGKRVDRVKSEVKAERSASTSVFEGKAAETIDGILDDGKSFVEVVVSNVGVGFDGGFDVEFGGINNSVEPAVGVGEFSGSKSVIGGEPVSIISGDWVDDRENDSDFDSLELFVLGTDHIQRSSRVIIVQELDAIGNGISTTIGSIGCVDGSSTSLVSPKCQLQSLLFSPPSAILNCCSQLVVS